MSSKIYMQIKCYIINATYQNQELKQKEKHRTGVHCFSILTADSNTMTMLSGSDRLLCSACSKGSSQHSSGADKQLRVRQIEAQPYVTILK